MNDQARANAQLLTDPNVQAYLRMIRQAEGADYDTLFGGGKFKDLTAHPNQSFEFTQTDGKKARTTAAGGYQYLKKTWDDVAGKLELTDFSSTSQDIGAVELLRRSGSLADVQAGRWQAAVAKDNKTWASLPGSPYAQKTRDWGFVQAALGGRASLPAMPQEGPKSGPGDANGQGPLLPPRPGKENALAASVAAGFLQDLSRAEGADSEPLDRITDEQADAALQHSIKASNTGFTDVFQASRQNPDDMPTLNAMRWLEQGPREQMPYPNWYADNAKEIEAPCFARGGDPGRCQDWMRENVTGPESMRAAQADWSVRMDNEDTFALAGPWATFFGRAAGGLTDPINFAAGVGTGGVFGALKLGHTALAAAGRPGLAALSLVAEGAAGNVAVTALQDAMGEVKTLNDYVGDAAMGAVLTAPFTRGTIAAGVRAELDRAAMAARHEGQLQKADALARLKQETGIEDPAALAREFQRRHDADVESIQKAAGTSNRFESPLAPEDVQEEIRREWGSGAPEPGETPSIKQVEQTATEAKPVDAVPDVPTVKEEGVEGSRVLPSKDNKAKVKLTWGRPEQLQGESFSVREVLEGMEKLKLSGEDSATLKYMRGVLSESVNDVRVKFGVEALGPYAGQFEPNVVKVEVKAGAKPGSALDQHLDMLDARSVNTVMHEVMHAATHTKIEAYRRALVPADSKVGKAAADLEKAFTSWRNHIAKKYARNSKLAPFTARDLNESDMRSLKALGEQGAYGGNTWYDFYASKNMHEFVTMAFTNPSVRQGMSQLPGRKVAGRPTSMWRDFVDTVSRLLGFDKEQNLWQEATAAVDRLIRADDVDFRYGRGNDVPAVYSANSSAQSRTAAERIFQHAVAWNTANPIDPAKLSVLTRAVQRFGGMSDGLVLASSANPVARMVAGLVTETTTGAAGRRSTVAIRADSLHKSIMGNAMPDYQRAYTTWARANNVGLTDTFLHGEGRRRFNRAVSEEILSRRQGQSFVGTQDASVREAADALEALFERSRQQQVAAGVLGADNLPSSAAGYMPQTLDGAAIQTLTLQELNGLHAELSRQLQARLGWNAADADLFAPHYVERMRKRAQGGEGLDQLSAGGGGGAAQVIRDTLETMAIGPQTRNRMLAAMATNSGARQTKGRLDLDLSAQFAPGRTLLDVYVQDPLLLARSQAKQVSGQVAMTEAGVLGYQGIRGLRDAMEGQFGGPGQQATRQELEAFDRVMAEIMGTQMAGRVTSAGATNLGLFTSMVRLGGMAVTQAMELWNMAHHMGLRSTLAAVGDIPRAMGEVGRLKRGQASGNRILTSLDHAGGEIGMEPYKMQAPLDPPDALLQDYTHQPGTIGRLLRGGSYGLAKISFFRGVLAAQHRAVAEQIVRKGIRYIRDGGNDRFLADMGFTPQVVAGLKQALPQFVQFDARGNITSLDLTRIPDPRYAEAFMQSVHRGTAQIIQGTFVGERNAWAHNDYIKLLTQFRTFSITATEKQLGRVAGLYGGGVQGYGYAAGLMLGQMAATLPVHLARVHAASLGREDREDYVKQQLNPVQLTRALMNYSSLSGLGSDVLELTTALAGGWGGSDTKELVGARQGVAAGSISGIIPSVGVLDQIIRGASGGGTAYSTLRALPGSSIPYILPLLNLAKE